ncbi:MAG: hypothetical protein CML05_13965 [Pseudozobellia sp.]|nr:hypothetical protein [Pseudozobellia sp.]|tara:strand:- start:2841 stop:3338 length:498 start_codon:yes stop_codon:yes gene_type:complete
MKLKNHIKSYAQFNFWANNVLADYIEKVPSELKKQQIQSSYPSLYETIEHMVQAQKFWLLVLVETYDYKVPYIDQRLAFEGFVDEFKNQSKIFLSGLEMVLNTDLERKIKTPFSEETINLSDVFIHVIDHETYHRGQLVTILRQLNLKDIPNTNYFQFCLSRNQL